MAELLNQKAIDRLMEGAKDPAAADGSLEIRSHSFLRPAHQEERPALVVDPLIQSLQSMLSIQLRTPVSITAAGVEEISCSEFLLSLGSPCAAFSFYVGADGRKKGVLDWGTTTALSFVDRLLGGDGESAGLARGLSRLEQGVIQGLTEQALSAVGEAWKESIEISPEITGFESNPARLKIAAPEERMMTTILEIRTGNLRGVSTIGIPKAATAAAQLDVSDARSSSSGEAGDPVVMESNLRHAHLSVAARLPTVTLSGRVIARLRPGQVIHTGHPSDGAVQVLVNGQLLFLGTMGRMRGHVGLRILQRASTPAPERLTHTKHGRVL